jgi:integrase
MAATTYGGRFYCSRVFESASYWHWKKLTSPRMGLRVSKSSLFGKASDTKNKKTRLAPLPPSLRESLTAWAATSDGALLFPAPTGKMYCRQSDPLVQFVERGRAAASIPDLPPRTCRATVIDRQQATVTELEARLSGKVVAIQKRA